MLTISLADMDDPNRKREIRVECNDMYDALYELQNAAGQTFRRELMGLSWQYLTGKLDPPPDSGVIAILKP